MITCNQPSHVSNLITTNNVDTEINNYDYTKSFSTPRKHRNRTPEILDANTKTTPVHPNVNLHPNQRSTSNPTSSLKLPLYGNYLSLFSN